MAARYEVVVAVRVPRNVERELKRRAHADDRTLSAFLRRQLSAMASGPAAGVESDSTPHENRRDDGNA